MSIDNPLVIINTLTAANIQQQNTIDDLRAEFKASREHNAALFIDKNKRIKELEEQLAAQAKAAAHNRPKYDYPYATQYGKHVFM